MLEFRPAKRAIFFICLLAFIAFISLGLGLIDRQMCLCARADGGRKEIDNAILQYARPETETFKLLTVECRHAKRFYVYLFNEYYIASAIG